jgi:hypothetical protein
MKIATIKVNKTKNDIALGWAARRGQGGCATAQAAGKQLSSTNRGNQL